MEFWLVLRGISRYLVYFLLDVFRGTCLIRPQQALLSFSVCRLENENNRQHKQMLTMARFMIMSMTAGRLWSTWLCLSVLSLATTTSPTTSSTVGGVVSAFTPGMDPQATPPSICLQAEKDNKAMAFLKKIGKVGGHHDFTHVVGIDEGSAGKHAGKGSVRTVSYSVYICVCLFVCVCVCVSIHTAG